MVTKTISDYNLIADRFSSTRKFVTKDLVEIADLVDKDQTVLDYGCGNGRMAKFFKPKKYFGVDPSTALISIAKSNYPEYKFSVIRPCQVIKKWNFKNILCLSMIHHLPNNAMQNKLIKNFADILPNGGKLIITAWHIENIYDNKIARIPFISGNQKITRHIYSFSLNELEQIINNNGFTVKKSTIKPRNKGRYSNIEIFAEKAN